MVKKGTRAKQQAPTADTRRSTRIHKRAVTGQADSDNNNTAAAPITSRPVRQVRQKKSTATTVSDSLRRNATTARSTSSTRHKRKRKRVSEASTSKINPANKQTSGRRRSKKVKITQSAATSRNAVSKQPSITAVQETQVASSVLIQDTTVPQITTTTIPVMQQPKRRGRPRKTQLTTDSDLSNGTLTAARPSKKRGHHVVEEDHRIILKPKRRKGDVFTVPIPIRPQQICKVYAIGSNEFSQCGEEDSENLKKVSHIKAFDQFDVVDISAGSLHGAALTVDGKVVTWGCNDHGTLGRFTDTPKSAEAKEILERGNYDIGEEEKPAYAEGLDNVNIVKVVCGGNATFAISDQGHLYATGTFKGKDGIIGFSYDKRTEQPIFTRYKPFGHLIVVDIAAGVDHALALTEEGDVYAWGSNEAFRLGKKTSERRPIESLIPFNLGFKHIVRLYSGAYHNFAIDDNGKVWVFGYNNMGQCGLSAPKRAIVPPEKHSFFNKAGQRVEEFAAGEHHTLARMQDGQVFSFGRADYGQLGLGDRVLPSGDATKTREVNPTIIPNLTSIKFVGAGDHFSMAVDTVNKIYAWGFGEYFVLGNRREEDASSPFRMPDLNGKDIARISCGSSHALFLMVDSGGNVMNVDTN